MLSDDSFMGLYRIIRTIWSPSNKLLYQKEKAPNLFCLLPKRIADFHTPCCHMAVSSLGSPAAQVIRYLVGPSRSPSRRPDGGACEQTKQTAHSRGKPLSLSWFEFQGSDTACMPACVAIRAPPQPIIGYLISYPITLLFRTYLNRLPNLFQSSRLYVQASRDLVNSSKQAINTLQVHNTSCRRKAVHHFQF